MVDCSDVLAYDEFKSRCVRICNSETFDFVIDELMRQGEVSLGTLANGERILKFKARFLSKIAIKFYKSNFFQDQSSKGPAKFTAADASVHELRRTMTRVDTELRRIEQRVKKFDEEARNAVHRKDRNGAMQALRKKKRAEKEMRDKDVQ